MTQQGWAVPSRALGGMTTSAWISKDKASAKVPGPQPWRTTVRILEQGSLELWGPSFSGRTMGPVGLESRAQSQRELFLNFYEPFLGGLQTFFFPLLPIWNENVCTAPVLPLYFGST